MSIKDRNLTVGTKLIGKYHKQPYTCQVIAGENGKLRYQLSDGREFKSPSAAAMGITGHAADGWMFWSIETAEAANPQTPDTNIAGSAISTEAKDAPAPDAETTTGKTFMRTPNQKGAPEGQTRWFCAECGESFFAPYGEIPETCPQGHKA